MVNGQLPTRWINRELIMQSIMVRGMAILALLVGGCATGADPAQEKAWEAMVAQDYPAARDRYEAILAENPDDPFAQLNLGVAYHNLGQYELARQHYQAAIDLGGDAQGTRVAAGGEVTTSATTVADKARENLATLPN